MATIAAVLVVAFWGLLSWNVQPTDIAVLHQASSNFCIAQEVYIPFG
jgi:hypothetical protein